jgi:hypothetical protein
MKKIVLITAVALTNLAWSQMPTPQIPYSEVTHEQKVAAITTQSGIVLEGKVNYNEYGDRYIYLFQNGEEKALTLDNMDTLQSMAIQGRGVFESVDLFGNGHKTMALVLEDNDAYKVYQLASIGQGLLGYKISGGNMEGEYLHFVLHKRNGKIYAKKDVKKIETTITQYIDYCAEITKKIENKEKGYKTNLMKPDFDLLKQAILESETTCPQ